MAIVATTVETTKLSLVTSSRINYVFMLQQDANIDWQGRSASYKSISKENDGRAVHVTETSDSVVLRDKLY